MVWVDVESFENGDDGVSVFDFTVFSSNFGAGVIFDTSFATIKKGILNQQDESNEAVTQQVNDESLMQILAEWNRR